MITFSQVNLINFKKIAGKFSANSKAHENLNQNQNYVYDKSINFTGNNLAPLKADTISFSGRKNTRNTAYNSENLALLEELAWSTQNEDAFGALAEIAGNTYDSEAAKKMTPASYSLYKDMQPVARELHKQAKSLENVFNARMWMFDGLLMGNGKKSPKIQPVLASKETRIKTQSSIAKKLASKFSDNEVVKDGYKPFVDVGIAKEMLHDIYGARLVLRTGTKREAAIVANRIIDSYKTGNGLKIKTIKNYGRSPRHQYLDIDKLAELSYAIEAFSGKRPEIINEPKKSGYTATHIIFEVGGGMDGEIQILGRGVLRVKEVEDVCYKGLQGKALEGMPEISKALKKIGKDPKLTDEFKEYLCSAYDLAKTEWDKLSDDMLDIQQFPRIPDKFPSCLDLNNIETAIAKAKEEKNKKKTAARK